MCLRGFTQLSSQATGPASRVPEPPAADPGATDEERVVELTAEGIDADLGPATADFAVARR
ncbi:MAG: hypothetical protein ACRDT4_04530 [Micromonosporaceae bacterium]